MPLFVVVFSFAFVVFSAAISSNSFATCCNSSRFLVSPLQLSYNADVSCWAAATTVSSGVMVGEVRYLCLKYSVSAICDVLVCLL